MIQCVICGTVFTKEGSPEQFGIKDRIIYGCYNCEKGDWIRHSKITLTDLVITKDWGYIRKDANEYADNGEVRVQCLSMRRKGVLERSNTLKTGVGIG